MQSYCSVYCCFFPLGVVLSSDIGLNVVIFVSQLAGQQPTIFAGQLAGLTEGLPVGSGHKNLDRFHLWCSDTFEVWWDLQ